MSVTASAPARDEVLHDLRHSNDVYNEDPPKKTAPPPPPDATPQTLWPEKTPLFRWPPELLLIVNALRRNAASELASQKGFDASLLRISNQIHNYYLLSFKPTGDSGPGLHSLRVKVPDYKDAVIQTRKNYWR